MLAYGLNERMVRKADYLREENRVLKDALRAATGKTQIPLTNEQRRWLSIIRVWRSEFRLTRLRGS